MRFALLAAALGLAACSPNEYHCAGDQECVGSSGKFGLCIDSHCALPDEACTGGLRFDDSAGNQANLCVSLQQLAEKLDAGVVATGAPDAPVVVVVDAPLTEDAPLAAPDAPTAAPDAPLAAPDAPTGAPDAKPPALDAPSGG